MVFRLDSVFWWVCVGGLLGLTGFARAEAVDLEGVPAERGSYREVIRRLEPMGLEGLDRQLASVLRDYYAFNYSSAEHWDTIASLRFEGVLEVPGGAVRFIAFKKKPDYCKVVLFGGGGAQIVMAYDGDTAWQLNPATGPDPVAMPEAEALNFIRDATTGGHLFYPLFPGKQIELVGTEVIEGERCYQLSVVLPNGQRILSFLNAVHFAEQRQITVNAVTGDEEVLTHSDIREVEGIRIPFQTEMTVDGEWVHTVKMVDVQVNLGVMPWMFARPSGGYMPGPRASGVPERSPAKDGARGASPTREAEFGTGAFDRFELQASELQSILEDLDAAP